MRTLTVGLVDPKDPWANAADVGAVPDALPVAADVCVA